jgi:hypothetical protein
MPDGKKVESGPFWIKYYRNGRPYYEPTHTYKESQAKRLLRQREGSIANGMPLNLRAETTTIDELLDDVLLDYRVNGKVIRFAENVINNHLWPYFKGRQAISIGTSDVQKYVQFRQGTYQGFTRGGTPTRKLYCPEIKRKFR